VWRRLIRCLELQVIFHKRNTNYRALLRRMTYTLKASYDSTPSCTKDPSFNQTACNTLQRTAPQCNALQHLATQIDSFVHLAYDGLISQTERHRSMLQYVAVLCSMVQPSTVWCSMVQYGAVWCCVVQCGAAWCSVLCSVVQCGAAWCSVVQCGAAWCNVVQCGVVCCRRKTHLSIRQSATHCNTHHTAT